MFDKVILNAHIACADHAEYLIYREHLQRCSEGDKVFWQSTSLANIDGVSMRLQGGNVQIKCSLHKMFYKGVTGHLDNTQMFTISQAKAIVHELLSRWEIDIGAVRVTYYEIGLNIPVNDDPLGYIASVHTIGSRQKEFFNDANFQKYRQKTTEKGRTIKKVFKIYDKGFEARSKDHFCDENILRLETIYRRQNIPLDVFLSDGELKKILDIYYRDWLSMEFDRRVVAEKGMKSSQLEKAVRIIYVMVLRGICHRCVTIGSRGCLQTSSTAQYVNLCRNGLICVACFKLFKDLKNWKSERSSRNFLMKQKNNAHMVMHLNS